MKNPSRKDKSKSTHDHAMKVFDQQSIDRIARLLTNSRKAIDEHIKKNKDSASVFATHAEAIPSIESIISPALSDELNFVHHVAEDQGDFREAMEDAHFYKIIDEGVLTGVFDGHGGNEVAEFSSKAFRSNFSKFLKKHKNDVRAAFENLFNIIHDEVAKKRDWDRTGSTAIICFIENKSNLIYTATLGDSEANIYRYINHKLKSIPLSCVRDWSSPKDARRAALALDDPSIAEHWPKAQQPKQLRFPSLYRGVNVSRSIGDVNWTPEKTFAISHTPKITINLVHKGDYLVLACDGLKDFVSEKEIVELIDRCIQEKSHIAKNLVDFAINVAISEDNVTAMVVTIS